MKAVRRMCNRFSNLKCKEVVNICDGARLGYVCDVEINTCDGRIRAIIVPGPCKCFGLLGRHDDLVIPWQCIRQIGGDIILVDGDMEKFRLPRAKGDFFR